MQDDEKVNDSEALALVEPADLAVLPELPASPAAEVSARSVVGMAPVPFYLSTLNSPASRKTVAANLRRIVKVASIGRAGPEITLKTMAWSKMTLAHTSLIRARVLERFAPKTFKDTMDALRGVLKACWKLDLMTLEAFKRATDWPTKRYSRQLAGRELSLHEVDTLNDYCNTRTGPYGAFLRALFAILFGAGLRATELGRMVVKGYERREGGGGGLRLIGKGDREDVVPIGEDECAALDEWLAARAVLEPKSPWLILRVTPQGMLCDKLMTETACHKVCRRVSKAARITKFSPHDCRRTFCTRQLRDGVPIQQVSRMMRHASITTTQRYDMTVADEDAASRQTRQLWRARPRPEEQTDASDAPGDAQD